MIIIYCPTFLEFLSRVFGLDTKLAISRAEVFSREQWALLWALPHTHMLSLSFNIWRALRPLVLPFLSFVFVKAVLIIKKAVFFKIVIFSKVFVKTSSFQSFFPFLFCYSLFLSLVVLQPFKCRTAWCHWLKDNRIVLTTKSVAGGKKGNKRFWKERWLWKVGFFREKLQTMYIFKDFPCENTRREWSEDLWEQI